jgi:hypothetical protein
VDCAAPQAGAANHPNNLALTRGGVFVFSPSPFVWQIFFFSFPTYCMPTKASLDLDKPPMKGRQRKFEKVIDFFINIPIIAFMKNRPATVRQLIKKLETMPQDFPVYVRPKYHGDLAWCASVSVKLYGVSEMHPRGKSKNVTLLV